MSLRVLFGAAVVGSALWAVMAVPVLLIVGVL